MFYIVFDFVMAAIMLLFGIWFYRSKGQASNFLSGYNMKSAEERKKYDENAMCKAYRNRLFNCMGDMVCYVYSAAYGQT